VDTSAFIGISFQTSTLASVVLFYICCCYLSKSRETPITLKLHYGSFGLVFFTLILILPANFSTTALIFCDGLMLVFIGKYPLKYIGIIIGSEFCFLLFL
jgi:cell division protein FtsW